MSVSCIQNRLLELTVVGCSKLKDTKWISRQDPYVCFEYGSTKFRTRSCTDGGTSPVFQEKFMFTLIEGLREINVSVWNSNTLTRDSFIGSGKIQLQDVLYRGYNDQGWPIHSKSGRHAGEVKLIMHFALPNAPAVCFGAPASPYIAPLQPQVMAYSVPPPVTTSPYANPACPPPYPPHNSLCPTARPYPSFPSCPPPHQSFSSAPYPPPPGRSIYPPPQGYPTSTYPPPPHASPYDTPSSFYLYPPPPYLR